MEKLSASLKAEIEKRPTQTYLRSHSKEAEQEYFKVPVLPSPPPPPHPLPENFKGQEVWKGLITPPMNQGSCGSCWAFASVSCLADRFNLQSEGKYHIQLSPAKMVLCDWQGKELDVSHPEDALTTLVNINAQSLKEGACYGNTLADAWRYLYLIGVPTLECIPYDVSVQTSVKFTPLGKFQSPDEIPLCQDIAGLAGDMCSDYTIDTKAGLIKGTPARMYRCVFFYRVHGVDNIRMNIYRWGPVSTGMKVYPDFYTFDPKTEIYQWNKEGPKVGGHAIVLIGWGVDNGVPFWWVKNSWGTDWGLDGYFRMIRGQNDCGIEENVIVGVPDFFFSDAFIEEKAQSWGLHLDLLESRKEIDTALDVKAGGIDPETGYTRRIMSIMPELDFTPPVSVSQLPDYTQFWASQVPKKHKPKVNPLTIIALVLGGLLVLLIVAYLLRKRR